MSKKGRIPMTPIIPLTIIRRDDYYPLVRCDDCPSRWKMRERDVATGSIRERSCKNDCVYAKGIAPVTSPPKEKRTHE